MQLGTNSFDFDNIRIGHDGTAVTIEVGTETYRFTDTGVLEVLGIDVDSMDSPDFGTNDISNVNRLDADEIIVQNAPSKSDELARNQDIPDPPIGTFARNINSLYQDTAEVQYSVGLNTLDYRNGEFDTFDDTSRTTTTTNVDFSNSELSLSSTATNGNAEYSISTDFTPSRVVIGADSAVNQGSISYEIEDGVGNVETITSTDTEVSLSSISDATITVRVVLDRAADTDTSPTVDSFALYLD